MVVQLDLSSGGNKVESHISSHLFNGSTRLGFIYITLTTEASVISIAHQWGFFMIGGKNAWKFNVLQMIF